MQCFAIGMKAKSEKVNLRNTSNQSIETTIEAILTENIHDKPKDATQSDAIQNRNLDKEFVNLPASFELSSYEQSQIAEILSYSEHIPEEDSLEIAPEMVTCAQFFNLTSFYARPGIKYCKKIPFFRHLNPDEQLRLIKPAMLDSMIIRVAFFYNKDRDTFTLAEVNQLKSSFGLTY